MRIWMINHYALSPVSVGGTRHYNFARMLQKKGHEVIIIAANFSHLSRSKTVTDKIMDTSYEVPFVWLPVPAYQGNTISRFWNMLSFSRQLLKNKFLRTLEPPDVILGSSPHLFAAFAAQRLAKRLKKPFILEIRDLWPDSLIDLSRLTRKHPIIKVMRWVESYLYKHAVRIISLLPNANQYLIERGVKPMNIKWLPNSVDIENIPELPARVPNNKFTVMYAGAHGVANNLETVISAAAILEKQGLAQQIRICLIGEGPEKIRLKQLAKEANLTIIEFMDGVPKKEIYSVLNQADVFLMLLKDSPVFRWGISPNKLFDYLALGRPVIFGVNTPFNPIKTHQAGISITSGDATELAAAIHQLSLLTTAELNEMGQRGREFVLQHHYLPQLTNELEELFKSVVQSDSVQFST